MTETLAIQEALVTALTALELEEDTPMFRTVEAYPLARLFDDAFPNDLMKLRLPGALVIFRDDNQSGRHVAREINWEVLLIQSGLSQQAAAACIAAADAIRTNVLNREIGETGKLWLKSDSRLVMLASTAGYTAAALSITTREHQ